MNLWWNEQTVAQTQRWHTQISSKWWCLSWHALLLYLCHICTVFYNTHCTANQWLSCAVHSCWLILVQRSKHCSFITVFNIHQNSCIADLAWQWNVSNPGTFPAFITHWSCVAETTDTHMQGCKNHKAHTVTVPNQLRWQRHHLRTVVATLRVIASLIPHPCLDHRHCRRFFTYRWCHIDLHPFTDIL